MAHYAQRKPGFSLFEVLVVLAIMSVVAGVVTLNFDRLIAAAEEKPLERVLFETIQEARIRAATTGNPVYLGFDSQSGAFTLVERARPEPAEAEGADGLQLGPLSPPAPLPAEPERIRFDGSSGTEVVFYPRISQPDFTGRGEAFTRDPATHLVFHPSGVSTPARVVIRQPGSQAQTFELDPMSSGPLQTVD